MPNLIQNILKKFKKTPAYLILKKWKIRIETLRFSPKGKFMVSVGRDGQGGYTRVWEVKTWKRVSEYRGHAGLISHAAISPDETLLATCGVDTTVLLWRLPK